MADDRRPRKPTIVMGAELRDDRTVQRRHPSYESPTAPRHSITEWPPDAITDPRIQRLPRVEPTSSDALQIRIPKGLILAIIGAVITAGASAIATVTRKPAASPELVVETNQRSEHRSESRDRRIIEMLEAQAAINQVFLDVACQINGGPPARGVKCRKLACEEKQYMPDGKTIVPGQPICVSNEAWPTHRQLP